MSGTNDLRCSRRPTRLRLGARLAHGGLAATWKPVMPSIGALAPTAVSTSAFPFMYMQDSLLPSVMLRKNGGVKLERRL